MFLIILLFIFCVSDLVNLVYVVVFFYLFDYYVCDLMGGGEGLFDYVKVNLLVQLKILLIFYGVLVFQGEKVVGLINCFVGFFIFVVWFLFNIYDIVVYVEVCGQGVGQVLLGWVEGWVWQFGCCKLIFEVFFNNCWVMVVYEWVGFVFYMLDLVVGQVLFLQKWFEED